MFAPGTASAARSPTSVRNLKTVLSRVRLLGAFKSTWSPDQDRRRALTGRSAKSKPALHANPLRPGQAACRRDRRETIQDLPSEGSRIKATRTRRRFVLAPEDTRGDDARGVGKPVRSLRPLLPSSNWRTRTPGRFSTPISAASCSILELAPADPTRPARRRSATASSSPRKRSARSPGYRRPAPIVSSRKANHSSPGTR